MSQNGPHPGPWSAGGSDEPYTEPADPWGDAHTPAAGWGAHPVSIPPNTDSSLGYHPASTPWSPPARPKRNTPIIVLVVVLALLICGGLGVSGWLLTRDPKPP